MRKLPWLSEVERAKVNTRIARTMAQEVYKRHWGAPAPGRSPGGASRFYIMDIRGLFMAAGILRYTLAQFATRVFYRGQSKDWEMRAALFRGASSPAAAKDRLRWLDMAVDAASPVFDPPSAPDVREALLQHYGLPTTWLDVVDNAQMACWFAAHRGDSRHASSARDDGSGYVSALACPTGASAYARALDLRTKPSEWLRPHVQQAWALRSGKPETRLGSLSHLHVCTFIVPRPLLRQWCAYEALPPEVVFPGENEDKGLYYWSKARTELELAGFYPPPWL